MDQSKYYKVVLYVDFKKEINLYPRWEEIREAADAFSNETIYRKSIMIVDIEENKLHLVVSFNVDKGFEKFYLKYINQFLIKFCSLYSIEYNSRKKYFRIEQCFSIDKEERREALGISMSNYSEYQCEMEERNKAIEEELSTMDTNYEIKDVEKEKVDSKKVKKSCKSSVTEELVPKRQFPYIASGTPRLTGAQKVSEFKAKSYDEVITKLNALKGLNEIKKQIFSIGDFIKHNNKRYVEHNVEKPGLFYNMMIKGNRGVGKNTVVKIIYEMLFHLGVIGEERFIIIDCKELHPRNSINRNIGNAQSGVILFDNAHVLCSEDRRDFKGICNSLQEDFIKYKNNFIFIMAGEPEGMNLLQEQLKIKNHMNFFIDLPDYSNNEMLELVYSYAEREKFKIEQDTNNSIIKRIEYERNRNNFQNVYTAERIVEEAIIQKPTNCNTPSILKKEDFSSLDFMNINEEAPKSKSNETNPFEELNSLIGLENVKEKVRQIAAYVETQLKRKEYGFKTGNLCLHMSLHGNPGTGKTTVARIIGKILYELGVLPSNKFIETSRQDFVGRYIGHTATKTEGKVESARGGVLFVDEAYNLWGDSERDFGYEAVSTIIKKMEDKRDNLVIIFAGYPREMERFINMNPGLRDRIAFKIDFPDYSAEELMEIFIKFLKDNEYEIDDEGYEEMYSIVNKLILYKDKDFSNARIIRKCFERIKMEQANRIIEKGLSEKEDLVMITLEDIKMLYDNHDIKELINDKGLKRCIGFYK